MSDPADAHNWFVRKHSLNPFVCVLCFLYVDNIKECVNYDCVQYTKQIVCSLDFLKLRASQKDLHFNDVTFTVLDCKKLRDLRECSLENGCDIIGSENVSISSNEKAYFTQMNTCYSHTYCIVAAVSMETGELAHFNTTSRKFQHEKHDFSGGTICLILLYSHLNLIQIVQKIVQKVCAEWYTFCTMITV